LLLQYSHKDGATIDPTTKPVPYSSTNQATKVSTTYQVAVRYASSCSQFPVELSAAWADDNIKFITGSMNNLNGLSNLNVIYGTTRMNAAKGSFGNATSDSVSISLPENDPIIKMTVSWAQIPEFQIVGAIKLETASGKVRTLGKVTTTRETVFTTSASNPIVGFFGCRVVPQTGVSAFGTIYPMIRTAKPAYQTEATQVEAQNSSSVNQQAAIIAGVVVGVFCLILLCVAIAYIVHRRTSHSGTQFYH